MTTARMVAGFLFRGSRVLLVRKRSPEWQAGMWNGVGGKIEDGETADAAMCREFLEETGLDDVPWRCFCTEIGPGYEVHFFRAQCDNHGGYFGMRTENDAGEDLGWHLCTRYDVIDTGYVGNLQWLLPMARDWRGLATVVYAPDDIRERAAW